MTLGVVVRYLFSEKINFSAKIEPMIRDDSLMDTLYTMSGFIFICSYKNLPTIDWIMDEAPELATANF
jgi:hypothetical protein